MYRNSLKTAVVAGIAGAAGMASAQNVGLPPGFGDPEAFLQHKPRSRDKGGPAHAVRTGGAATKRAARTRRNIRARSSKRRGAA